MNHCFCKTKTDAIYFGQSQRNEISSTNQTKGNVCGRGQARENTSISSCFYFDSNWLRKRRELFGQEHCLAIT